jgi:putative SOS response-associated peptidase YedK
MCGRYGIAVDFRYAMQQYKARVKYEFGPNYNVSPGQMVPAVVWQEEEPVIEGLKWGFIPHWAKDPSIGFKMINARAESADEKPAFRKSFQERRCIILSTGFYEWKKDGQVKTPYYLQLKERPLFGFAGLWTRWSSPEGEEVRSCTIITTEPNSVVSEIHNRMPVVLRKESEKPWLDPDNKDSEGLKELLAPYPPSDMKSHEVSRQVNFSKNNTPDLIKPVLRKGLDRFMSD